MSKFERKFHQRDWREIPVVRELLRHWVLPGEEAGESGLRVAVRNNYCNFYRKGQSVAKLHSTSRSLKLEVHEEYVDGSNKAERARDGRKALTGYTVFGEEWLRSLDNVKHVADWIARADSYAGAEKAFVDDLVARNPGTVDLEMGLPAYDGEKSAPRMDLVLVEETARGPALAFWEAKCADNGEARAEGVPHVVKQIEKYEQWMAKPGREADVISAYRGATRILLELCQAAEKLEGAAIDLWTRFRDSEDGFAIRRPGVVVGGYCPAGVVEANSGSIVRKAESYVHKHQRRLRDEYGIVEEYFASFLDVNRPLRPLAGEVS